MKRLFFFLVVSLFLAVSPGAYAQVKFGVKGGYNITHMSVSEDVLHAENRNGFFIGPTLKCELPLGLGFDLSALYDQREAKIGELEPVTLTQKMVTIPANVRLTFGSRSALGLFVYAGPQIGFSLNDDEKVYDQVRTWKYKESNFSVNLGAGLLLLDCLQVSVNYNVVCGKTADVTWVSARDKVEDELESKTARANAWQLSATIYF